MKQTPITVYDVLFCVYRIGNEVQDSRRGERRPKSNFLVSQWLLERVHREYKKAPANAMISVPQKWFVLIVPILLFSVTLFWALVECGTLDALPGVQGDDVFYDNIAFNLANGNGYSLDFQDKRWVQPYRTGNTGGQNDWILQIEAQGPTATRAPLGPGLLSLVYRIAGRRFEVVRILNIVALTVGLTTLLVTVYRISNGLVASLATVTIAFDFAVLRTAGQVMTEALATAWVAIYISILAVMFCQSRKQSEALPLSSTKDLRWLAIGAGLGILALIRSNAYAWFALIVLGFGFVVCRQLVTRRKWKPYSIRFAWFVLGMSLVAGGWWTRNCIATGHFAPFGTSGSMGITGGYSDGAFRNAGNWDLAATLAANKKSVRRYGSSGLSLAEFEYYVGVESQSAAIEWVKNNPEKLPRLIIGKAANHLGFSVGLHPAIVLANLLLLIGALIGFWTHDFGKLTGLALGLGLITAILTYSHFGRYSIPIRPLLHVSSAFGVVWFWALVLRRFRRS